MARPSSHNEIADHEKVVTLASFSLSEISDNPGTMSAYAAFIAAAKESGDIVVDRSTDPAIRRKRADAELNEILANRQAAWDATDKRYREVRDAFNAKALDGLKRKWKDYEAYTLRAHAEREGYWVFPLISNDDAKRTSALAAANAKVVDE
ncbi:DUF7432 family protein [Mycolicibacterium fortuitum]|uniref:DUF7432 family protein n=1 Tax=Mycolicibacterium fortuitum TaxID=1766 RepID=UPI0026251C20|nr:hypothetical protein [Mycolicibacterium fortuitum]